MKDQGHPGPDGVPQGVDLLLHPLTGTIQMFSAAPSHRSDVAPLSGEREGVLVAKTLMFLGPRQWPRAVQYKTESLEMCPGTMEKLRQRKILAGGYSEAVAKEIWAEFCA